MSTGPWVAPMVKWKIPHIKAGLRLRELGLPYSAIAVVLAEYHGLENCNADRARAMLRSHGAAPKPHGPAGANLRRGRAAA